MFEDEERKNLSAIARQVEEQTQKEVQETIERIKERNRKENLEQYGCDCPAAKCYASCPRYLTHSNDVDLLYWLARTSPPDNKTKDYLQPMPAPPAKSGGSKSGRKRKNKKINDLRQYVLS
ncbi:MAG: hypothetical protein ACOY4I_04695 [Bacillota bacterium]